jgi:hypothetical protein
VGVIREKEVYEMEKKPVGEIKLCIYYWSLPQTFING